MRLAVIGLGSAALRGHLPALAASGVAVVAGADDRLERREAAAAALAGAPTFASAETMLDTVACDAVLVATEPTAHAPLVETALGRGLHVICEKPFVLSRTDQDRLARRAASSSSAIISVHQYGYARPAAALVRAARLMTRLRRPYALQVDVRRTGPDPLAVTSWRADPARSGGILADHGVHYLALAWSINEQLDVLAATHTCERSDVLLYLGAGTASLHLHAHEPHRSTRIALHFGDRTLLWSDDAFELRTARRRLWSRPGDGLASRVYVDRLYERFYRDVAHNLLNNLAWRQRRTAETLIVSRTLLSLLEQTGIHTTS